MDPTKPILGILVDMKIYIPHPITMFLPITTPHSPTTNTPTNIQTNLSTIDPLLRNRYPTQSSKYQIINEVKISGAVSGV